MKPNYFHNFFHNPDFLRIRSGIILAGILSIGLLLPASVSARELPLLTEDQLSEIQSRMEEAFQNGRSDVDLSDLDIMVNMLSTGFSPEYKQLLDLTDAFEEKYLTFHLGTSHSEDFGSVFIETLETDECDEWGVGPNKLTRICFSMLDEDYQQSGSEVFDLEQIRFDQRLMQLEYDYALSTVTEDMSDLDKALVLHDYLVSLNNYPDDDGTMEDTSHYDTDSYGAVGLLRDHNAVCAAYATVYSWLLSDCGIPAVTVSSTDMCHEWTMVQIDGEWYHVDVTWDDIRYDEGYTFNLDYNADSWDIGAISHSYFLLTDDEIRTDHYGWELDIDWSNQGITKTPQTPASNSYPNYLFRWAGAVNPDTHFCRLGDSWYFAAPWIGILKANTLSDQQPAAVTLQTAGGDAPGYIRTLYSTGSLLVFNTDTKVYGFDPENDFLFLIYDASETNVTTIISEMSYYTDTLHIILITPEDPESSGASNSTDNSSGLSWTTSEHAFLKEEIEVLYQEALADESTELN